MTDLRILVAKALNSSDLEQSAFQETAIDRIGALAFADPLGASLWALKWAGEPRAYPRALALLTHRSKRSCGDLKMRRKLCRAVLIEWLDDLCNSCGGRGSLEATPNAPVRTCEVCHGSGKRKISDLWRASQLGLDIQVYRKWEHRFVAVQRTLVDAEGKAWRDIAKQLGRIQTEALRTQPVDISKVLSTIDARGPNMRAEIASSGLVAAHL